MFTDRRGEGDRHTARQAILMAIIVLFDIASVFLSKLRFIEIG